jgi:anti-sigma factor RsiW
VTGHLGTQISALADGQLRGTAADRALAHIAACDACAAELASAHAARQALAAAFDVPVDPALTQRLLALGGASGVARAAMRPPSPASHRRPLEDSSAPLPGSSRDHLVGCGDGSVRIGGLPARVAATLTMSAAALAAVLLTLGELPAVESPSDQAFALTVLARAGAAGSSAPAVQDARANAAGASVASAVLRAPDDAVTTTPDATSDQLPDPSLVGQPGLDAWLTENSWRPVGPLPQGYELTAIRTAPGSIELDLDGAQGVIVVMQDRGRLDEDVVDRSVSLDLGNGELLVLSSSPCHVVAQSGDVVVGIVAEMPGTAAHDLLSGVPSHPYDARLSARLARGWTALTGAWTP